MRELSRAQSPTGESVSQQSHDLVFLKHFTQVMLFLVGLAVLLAVVAALLHANRTTNVDEAYLSAKVTSRIQSPAGVYAGETGAAAIAAAAEAAAKAAAGKVAYDGTLDGSVIYNALCGACHTTGAGGAPVMDRASWDGRIAQGVDTLIRHAIDGYQGSAGLMPARGGNPSLTDEQVEASVRWMLDNLN